MANRSATAISCQPLRWENSDTTDRYDVTRANIIPLTTTLRTIPVLESPHAQREAGIRSLDDGAGESLETVQTRQFRWFSVAGSLLVHASLLLILAAWLIHSPPVERGILIQTSISEEAGADEPMEMSVTEELDASATVIPTERLFAVASPTAAASRLPHDVLNEATLGIAAGVPGKVGGSPNDGKGSVGFFGLQAEGSSFVFIVDFSGSMKGSRFSRARSELVRTLGELTAKQQFFVIFYNHHAQPMYIPGKRVCLVPATRTMKRRARRWINDQQARGGTFPDSALKMALRLKPDVIFFLSDGAFQRTARTVAREANEHGTIIHTIAFEFDGGKLLLKGIAEDNDGRYRFVE